MIIGVFIGPLVDRFNKKTIMIATDIGAGLSTLILFLLFKHNVLKIWHIYCLNIINSILARFQAPASNVAVSQLVSKEYYLKANGLQSFSDGLIHMLAPVFAAFFLSLLGIVGVIIIDFITMIFACLSLTLFVKIPFIKRQYNEISNKRNYFRELKQGFTVVKSSYLLKNLMLFMFFINFAAGMAYHTPR